ncbi:MAG: helix-turn-helix domain-containing protein [Roseburia sp.]|nr:helix-turn-helix domain-containing protein [Roseburia sp.]
MEKQYKLVHNIKKYKLRSVYSQLVVMVVALTTVLAVISVIILCFLRNNMIEREKKVQEVNLEYTIEQLDEVIRSTYQAIYSIIGSSEVIDGLFDYDRDIASYAENKDIIDIISRLYLVYHSDENVKNVFIIQGKLGVVIDQNGITDKSIYFKNNFGDAVEFWEELAEQRHKFTLRMSEDSSSLYVLHSMYYANKRFATLCMELDMNKLHDRETFHEFVKNRIVCLTDTEENIVGYLSESRDDALINEAIHEDSVKGYVVLSGSTSAKELKVIALTPVKVITGESTVLFAVSLVVFAVAIILGITAAICIAGRIYRPLLRAVELIELAGNRGGDDEFEIIEHNVNAILEHNRAMTAVVKRSTPVVLETMFRRLIMEVDSDKDFEEMLDMMSIEVRDGYYMAVVVYDDNESENMEEAIDGLFADDVVSLFKRHKGEYVLMLYLQQEASRDMVLERCKKLLEQTDAIIAVGKAYKNVYSIGKSYNDALQILDSRKVGLSETEVFDAECDCEYVGYELPGDTESVLYNYIISGNCPLVIETINQSLRKNLERGISFKEYLQLISVYELYLMRVYENIDASAQERNELAVYSGTTFRMRTVEKRVECMLENYRKVTEFYDKKMHTEVMEQILKYIEDNMERDIGLDDVAAAVNLTPNYITKYFKNKSGMNFKTCLTMKRMEKAKELLMETEMTVKEIAEKCGYNSSKQLIVNFTKMTGIAPTEYRKCHKI